MTRNHPAVGGDGKQAKDGPPRLNKAQIAAQAMAQYPCDCGRKIKILLDHGPNEITAICECGAALTARGNYRGGGLMGMSDITMTIEKVEK